MSARKTGASGETKRRGASRRVVLAVSLALGLTGSLGGAGCGGGGSGGGSDASQGQASEACGRSEVSQQEQTSWLGTRPAESDAGSAYDRVQAAIERTREHDEIREIGELAFFPETIPALVTFMERGDARQRRAAFSGLRALVDGIARAAWVDDTDDYERRRRQILPALRRPEILERIEAALDCLPPPGQRMYRPVVDRIVTGSARPPRGP